MGIPADLANGSWVHTARRLLVEQRLDQAGWPYRPKGMTFAEPTAIAALALLAMPRGDSVDPAVRKAADWLADVQQADGSVGLSADITAPGWPTAYAVLVWAALDDYRIERKAAIAWLLDRAGVVLGPADNTVIGHDTTIVGWPWVDGTASWVEPTALAILALRRESVTKHPRLSEGIRMIGDRATPGGGWNCGAPSVFGKALRAHPAPTGFALLALAGCEVPTRWIDTGCHYLRRALPRVRSPRSLGWGILGLDAYQQRPAAADAWLKEAYLHLQNTDVTTMDLAQLLLASSRRSLELLGLGFTDRSRHEFAPTAD